LVFTVASHFYTITAQQAGLLFLGPVRAAQQPSTIKATVEQVFYDFLHCKCLVSAVRHEDRDKTDRHVIFTSLFKANATTPSSDCAEARAT
jgi:hypothetical protein